MSRLLHTPSLELDRIHPSRRLMRQQWVSTGKTMRRSEYIITHRATLSPTPGREVKKASQSASLIRRSGASVTFPNRA